MTDKEKKNLELFNAMHHILEMGQKSEARELAAYQASSSRAVPGAAARPESPTAWQDKVSELCEVALGLDFELDQSCMPLGDFMYHPALVVAAIMSGDADKLQYVPYFNDDLKRTTGVAFRRALIHWGTMVEFLQSELSIRAPFEQMMSSEQLISAKVLLQWWTKPVQDSELIMSTKRHLLNLSNQNNWSLADGVQATMDGKDEPSTSEAMTAELHRSFFLDALGLVWQQTLIHKSMYHKSMLQLFAMEYLVESRILLLQSSKDKAKFRHTLQEQRQICASYSSLNNLVLAVQSDAAKEMLLPEALSKAAKTITRPVPWLGLEKKSKELPYFLWDVAKRRTVIANELAKPVEYICISYSWGRWRVPHDQEDAFTRIPGVDWEVPRNTRFKVEALPEEFARIFNNSGYLWFDLFVIPQDNSELALDEVSRQDLIFTNAKHCIAWLHDVEDWTQLTGCLREIGTRYGPNDPLGFMYPHFRYGTDQFTDPKTEAASTNSIEFYTTSESLELPAVRDVIGWLTSLWTLQEICLRPDMILCSRRWIPLTIGNVVISFDSLIATQEFQRTNIMGYDSVSIDPTDLHESDQPMLGPPIRAAQDLNRPHQLNKDGTINRVEELRQLLVCSSGLSDLRDLSRAAIFNLAQKRTCVESRAEAIMSVVGATKWYKKPAKEQGRQLPQLPLVLGQYPTVFLTEAAEDIGFEFFGSMRLDDHYLNAALSDSESHRWRSPAKQIVGSLLPFTNTKTQLCPFPRSMQLGNFKSHPTVKSWKILDSGIVRIRHAGILASTKGIHKFQNPNSFETRTQLHNAYGWKPAETNTEILAPCSLIKNRLTSDPKWIEQRDGRFESDNVKNLQKWLDDIASLEETPVYAVCLGQQRGSTQKKPSCFGVLLKKVGPETDAAQNLISVGNFFSYAPEDWVKSWPIDWCVI